MARRATAIIATVFGGKGDPNTSAYDGHVITDDELGVALPWRFKGERPKVRVIYKGKSVICPIVDVGPWSIDDPYWELNQRPQAESGIDKKGRKTNKAGIDLTPATARALGFNGKALVDWEFVGPDQPQFEPQPTPEPPPKNPLQIILDFILSIFRAIFGQRQDEPAERAQEPRWLTEAKKDLGFRETGKNRGIETFIQQAKVGRLGDPWCAIFVNSALERRGIPGTRSAMARSFERHHNFVRLDGPALGAIATFWRGSPKSRSGHVNFYAGTLADGRNIGIGGNQSDRVSAAVMDMKRHTGWWWPKGEALPPIGIVRVTITDVTEGGSET